MLQDRLPLWLRAPRVLFVFTAILGAFFWYLNTWPLWHTDLWGHLAYGRWIWEWGTLPSTEPLMPLAEGMRFVDTSWLSQLVGYLAVTQYGTPALHFGFAALVTLCLSLLSWRFYRRTHNAAVTLAAVALFTWVEWEQLAIIRPQLAGLACFVGLFVLLTSRRWSRWNWLIIPMLFSLWANLHGSFIIGIALLGCCCAGRAIDLCRKPRGWRYLFRDRWFTRYFLLIELAAAAALLNPYGLELYSTVFTFAANENLSSLVEWQPLTLQMAQGKAALAAALLIAWLYRFSPRRISAVEIMLLMGLGLLSLWTSRMIVWWGPVAAYCVAVHANAVWRKWQHSRWRKYHPQSSLPERQPSPRKSTWSVATAGLIWIFIAYTPLGISMLDGGKKPARDNVSVFTPVEAAAFLNDHPPRGQVFNTFEWGDYLLWAGPKDVQVFVNSHAHLVPEEVWSHYLQIIEAASGWDALLDRYGVETILVDPSQHVALSRRLRDSDTWKIDYEDQRALVLSRREHRPPAPINAAAPNNRTRTPGEVRP